MSILDHILNILKVITMTGMVEYGTPKAGTSSADGQTFELRLGRVTLLRYLELGADCDCPQ